MSSPSDHVRLANAPVSYGAFEVTVGRDDRIVPESRTVVEAVAKAGYRGIDLGPAGYLGREAGVADRLRGAGLELAGGFLEFPFSVPQEFEEAFADIDALLDVLDAFSAQHAPPRATLADVVRSVERQRWPGRSARDRSFGLDDSAWSGFAERVQRVVDHCRHRSHEPSFHHHTASWVEAEWEIERILELTDVNLCLDTGHLLLGWGNPVKAIREWDERINHIHLKDAHTHVLRAIVEDGAPLGAIWESQAFCALGDGDVDLDGVLDGLAEVDYRGWIVVEQDVVLDQEDDLTHAIRDQVRNREYLAARGL